jgi:hypothetical protein
MIRQQVADASSFQIAVARLEIGGYCPDCQTDRSL